MDDNQFKMNALRNNPNITPEHISKALNDEDWRVRNSAINHPNATAYHISKAMADDDSDVRYSAIRHPKANSEHITKALGDKESEIRYAAIRHPNATTDHITKALGDENVSVRYAAIRHPDATTDHITKALGDKESEIRYAAIRHPNATEEHIKNALTDKDHTVRFIATAKIEKRNYQKITESLDSPATIEKIPETSMLHMMGSMSAQMVGGNNFSMHKIGDNLGYLIRYEKEGHTEFHHVDENLGGGYKQSIPTKGGLKFVSTMVDSIKKSLDSGESVKISAHHNLSNNFGRIIDRVSKRYPEYVVSNGAEETHPITQDKLKSWTIKHR